MMEMMSDAAKKELHDLVDTLPASEVAPARRYLEFLREHGSNSDAQQDEHDPFAGISDEERARLHAALEQSEREFASGRAIPVEDVQRELRSSR
jgi:hypothetical protein